MYLIAGRTPHQTKLQHMHIFYIKKDTQLLKKIISEIIR